MSIPAYLIPSTSETKVGSEYNIAIGVNALVNNSNVSYNMSDGKYSSLPNLTGVNNTAVGDSSLQETKGKNNSALGYKTGISNIIGNNNTFLGNSADCSGNNLNNSTAIGYKSKITESNQIVLGNSDTTQIYIPSDKASIILGSTTLNEQFIGTLANKSYVDEKYTTLIGDAGTALNTLGKISDALGDDANLAGRLTNSILLSAPKESPIFTGTVTGVSKAMVGLENVDNTSDALKPVSNATLTALDLKANKNGITKSMVIGLENVDNIPDALKPVSNATLTALDLKADKNGITKSMVIGLENVDNIPDALKPVSNATLTALNLKADLSASCRTIIVPLTATIIGKQAYPTVMPTAEPRTIRELLYDGWYYKKTLTDSVNNKINWYFGGDNGMTVGNIKQIYFEIKLIKTASPPFLVVYTKPTGRDDDAFPGFFRSSRVYTLPNVGLTNNTNYCCYYKFDSSMNDPVSYGHTNKVLEQVTQSLFIKGPFASDEEVFFAFATDSGASINNVELICKSFNVQSNKGTINFLLSNIHVDLRALMEKYPL